MKSFVTAIVLTIVMLFAAAILLSGCALKRVSLPLSDVEALNALGTAEIPKFVEHYKSLYEEQRPPTSEEFGYWTAKYEVLNQLYLFFKGKIKVSEMDNVLQRLVGNNTIYRLLEALFL